MKQIIWLFFLAAALFALCLPADKGHAVEYSLGVEVFEGVFRENNFTDASTATLDYDETYNILGVYPDIHLDLNDYFMAYALAEVEWFYSWDAESTADENDVNATMADIFVNFRRGGVTLDVGLQPFVMGKGRVFYSDEPGISIRYDRWQRVYLKASGLRVFDHSSMAMLSVGYRPGFLESVEILSGWYHDADDSMAELYQPFYEDVILKSAGDFFYAGVQADFFVRDFYISGLMMQQFGSARLDDGMDRRDFDLSAYLMDLEVNYNISGQLTVGAFLFSANGDNSPTTGNLHAFMSPMPFNPTTTIFFNGGFERYNIEDALVLGGVTWDGVTAPGIKIEYQPCKKVVTKLVTAALFPRNGLTDTGEWYGVETDMRVSYEFYQNHQLFFEAGFLYHGRYFEKAYGFRPDNATRLVGGLNFVF